jgi:hypothetical protein
MIAKPGVPMQPLQARAPAPFSTVLLLLLLLPPLPLR